MIQTTPARLFVCVFFFNDTATTEIYTLSLHDALPIFNIHASASWDGDARCLCAILSNRVPGRASAPAAKGNHGMNPRSEEHTSELQSRQYLVCRLLLEKKKKTGKCTISE